MIREPLEVISKRIQNTFKMMTKEKDKMVKIYYATSIATQGETLDSIRVANNLRNLGYEVYVASEIKSINDKSNNPTPEDIFNGDIYEILSSEIGRASCRDGV